jgi:hypothetical protein
VNGDAISSAVAAIFGAVVGVLGSLAAFTPRLRAIERDQTASEAMRKEQREGDARLLKVELEHMERENERQFSDLRASITTNAERARADCAGSERREMATLRLVAQVAGKLNVEPRKDDPLQAFLLGEQNS